MLTALESSRTCNITDLEAGPTRALEAGVLEAGAAGEPSDHADRRRLVPDPAPPPLEAAAAFGVDLTLLRERLRMTPAERLERHAQARARVALFRAATPIPDDPDRPPPREAR